MIFAFVIYSDVFHRRIRLVETLFISLRALSECSKTFFFFTVFTLLLSTMVSMSHISVPLTNSPFLLILSESHMGCLIWVKFVEIPKQEFESQLNVIYLFFIL